MKQGPGWVQCWVEWSGAAGCLASWLTATHEDSERLGYTEMVPRKHTDCAISAHHQQLRLRTDTRKISGLSHIASLTAGFGALRIVTVPRPIGAQGSASVDVHTPKIVLIGDKQNLAAYWAHTTD